MGYANTIADVIGNTPLVKLQKLSIEANLFAKCEFLNPISIKDRPVLNIINDAERTGVIKPGDTLIEMTSGNTGMAIAYISAVRGYRAILVMSEIQSVERRKIVKAFGAVKSQISKKVYEKVEFSLAIFTKRIPCLFKEYLDR